MPHGTIAKRNADKGFAFIREGDNSYFLHVTAVDPKSEVTFAQAAIGDLVDFDPEDNEKGPQAINAFITRRPAGQRHRGTMKTWNERGFGFIRAEDGHEYFCHATVCQDFNPGSGAVGTNVTFELVESTGGKMACLDVRRDTDETADELHDE